MSGHCGWRAVAVAAAIALSLATLTSVRQAAAEKRLALVVGNNAYPNLSADQQLANALNDAGAVKKALEQDLGFQVIYGENLDRRAFVDKLFELTARLSADDIALFFFAGHGVALSGANYLLPSDIPTPRTGGRAEEARLADQAIAEAQVIERITGSGARVAIMVLDACRDNPLRGPDTRSLGGTRGLSQSPPPQGVFSIYSAGFGQEALDRLGPGDRSANSVFTRVFVEKLKTRGLDLRGVATETRREVVRLAQTVGHNQFPAYYDQISGDVYLPALPPSQDESKPPLPRMNKADVVQLFSPFSQVLERVRNDYVEQRDDRELLLAAIDAIRKALPAHQRVSGGGQSLPSKPPDTRAPTPDLHTVYDIALEILNDRRSAGDDIALVEDAINGMLATLDPHSGYLTATALRAEQLKQRGEFGGVGIEVRMDENKLRVVAALEDTPAAK